MDRMIEKSLVKSFRVTMSAHDVMEFELVKRFLGLRNDAEVLRFLIHNFYMKDVKVHLNPEDHKKMNPEFE